MACCGCRFPVRRILPPVAGLALGVAALGCGGQRFAGVPVIEANRTEVVRIDPTAARFTGRMYLPTPAGLPGAGDRMPDVTGPVEVFAGVDPDG